MSASNLKIGRLHEWSEGEEGLAERPLSLRASELACGQPDKLASIGRRMSQFWPLMQQPIECEKKRL